MLRTCSILGFPQSLQVTEKGPCKWPKCPWVMPQMSTRHVTYINESCHKYLSQRVTSHIWMRHVAHAYGWVMSQIWMRHIIHMNESWHTCQRDMSLSHMWMSNSTYMNSSSHTYEWVMSQISTRHVTYMNESCHTYDCVMSQIWKSQIINVNASCHKYQRNMSLSQIWMSYVTHMNASGHTHKCVESHPKNELWHTHEKVISHKQMTLVTVTQANNWRHTCRATHMHEQCQVRDKNIKTGPAANKNWCVISSFLIKILRCKILYYFDCLIDVAFITSEEIIL